VITNNRSSKALACSNSCINACSNIVILYFNIQLRVDINFVLKYRLSCFPRQKKNYTKIDKLTVIDNSSPKLTTRSLKSYKIDTFNRTPRILMTHSKVSCSAYISIVNLFFTFISFFMSVKSKYLNRSYLHSLSLNENQILNKNKCI